MNLYYSPAYVASKHAFETTRKSAWVAESLSERPIAGVQIVAPIPLDDFSLSCFHDRTYVEAVWSGEPRGLAESNTFAWDKGIWKAATHSTGGVVDAALDALRTKKNTGSLSSGLHHAYRSHGSGFCTFNGLAIAAKIALQNDAEKVLILDLDAHCGGGTFDMIQDEPAIHMIDISMSDFDGGYGLETDRPVLIYSAKNYNAVIEETLDDTSAYDLCIYNAGMDPFGHSGRGGGTVVTATQLAMRERAVFEWGRRTKTPIAFVLAGGYLSSSLDKKGLVDLHRMTIEEATK